MNRSIRNVRIKSDLFILISMPEENSYSIEYKGKNYTNFAELVAAAPVLSNPAYLVAFVQIANFMFTGDKFTVIEDTAIYKRAYQEAIQDYVNPYGNYDISSMTIPEVIPEGKVIFFVENPLFHVPYEVTCTYPFVGKFASFEYRLFPQALRADV